MKKLQEIKSKTYCIKDAVQQECIDYILQNSDAKLFLSKLKDLPENRKRLVFELLIGL